MCYIIKKAKRKVREEKQDGVFKSVFIYLFLPLNLILYFISSNKTWRNGVLLAFSFFFYAWGEPVWVFMLMLTAFLDYTWARCIEYFRLSGQSRRMKLALAASLLFDLGMLGVFKYSGFFVENLNLLTGLSLPVPQISLPIGISFYTFQTISYVLDVYRGQVPAQKSYCKYLMYLSSYHQLVAGPIVRYSDVAAQIEERHTTPQDMSEGITRFCIGLTKKVVVANAAGKLVEQYLNAPLQELSVAGAWFGVLLYSIQLYYDFSAYSDMAIGLGRMFGFHYHTNFNYPYLAKSVTDFWRRWHISLGSFFRDYVYIPLGGNRRHQLLNISVVWLLTGLWHGASWNFVLWGAFYGILLMVEKLGLLRWLQRIPVVFSHLYLLFVTLIGWTLFYTTDLSRLAGYFQVMFGGSGNPLTDPQLSITFANHLFLAAGSAAVLPAADPVVQESSGELGGTGRQRAGQTGACFHRDSDDECSAAAGVYSASGRGQLQSVFIFPFLMALITGQGAARQRQLPCRWK